MPFYKLQFPHTQKKEYGSLMVWAHVRINLSSMGLQVGALSLVNSRHLISNKTQLKTEKYITIPPGSKRVKIIVKDLEAFSPNIKSFCYLT